MCRQVVASFLKSTGRCMLDSDLGRLKLRKEAVTSCGYTGSQEWFPLRTDPDSQIDHGDFSPLVPGDIPKTATFFEQHSCPSFSVTAPKGVKPA